MAAVSSVVNAPLVLRLVSSAVAAANKAGLIIRNVLQNGDLAVVNKGDDGKGEFDPQTIADRAAQKCIVTSLQTKFPAVTIVGEEEDCSEIIEVAEIQDDTNVLQQQCPAMLKDVREEEVVIWVDPLDGTREFTDGLIEHVTVLIGISHDGKPIAGVIHQPFFKSAEESMFGRTIWGVQGIGAFGYQHTKHDGIVVTTTRSHSSEINTSAISAMKPSNVLRVGGSGYKSLLVLLGDADAYLYASKGTKLWDTCAPHAILAAAGGDMTDILGNPINYRYNVERDYMNYRGILATYANHENFVSKIPENVRACFSNI